MDSRIIYLFIKYLNGECNQAELDQVASIIKRGEYEAEWEVALSDDADKLIDEQSETPVPEHEANRIYDIIEDNLGKSNDAGSGYFSRNKWPLFGIAASVLVLIAFATNYFLLKPDTSGQNLVVKNAVQEITPGSNKAILTLAGGQQVVLNGSANGKLAEQGGAAINKTAEGLLVYDGASSAGQTKAVFNTITTPRGGKWSLTLSDGTRVWLNSASSITYPTTFDGTDRRVSITGEAYFEVAHNAKKPFKVNFNDQVVEVLGTHFNINAYNDEPDNETTLLEGSVRITKGKNTEVLKPRERASVSKNAIEVASNVDVERTMAWKDGLFVFDRTELQKAMREIARWYDIDVVYQGNVKNDVFNGRIKRDNNLSQILKVLELGDVHFRVEGRKVTVLP